MEGRGGYPVVVYGEAGGRMRVDDRGLAPLTVARDVLDAARARVGSYKHRLCVIEPDREVLGADELRTAVRAGLADAAEHLAAASDSFGLPAWRKWSRMMTATRGAKAWPRVFAERRGLAGALLSTYEGIEPVGLDGGHLRGLYADFLDEAAALLEEPRLAGAAVAWRAAGELWHELAELVLPPGRVRELLVEVHAHVVERGDEGARGRRDGGGGAVGAARGDGRHATARRGRGPGAVRRDRRATRGDLRGRDRGRGAGRVSARPRPLSYAVPARSGSGAKNGVDT